MLTIKKLFLLFLKVFLHLLRVLEESLTNPDKEYSSKKIMTFISFNLCVFLALVDMFTQYKIQQQVFDSFLFLAGGSSVLSVIGNTKGK